MDQEKLFPLQMAVAKCKSRKQWPFSTLHTRTAGEKPYKVRIIDGSVLPSEFGFRRLRSIEISGKITIIYYNL